MERHETIIVGGGQAGLAMSWHLRQRGREHLLIEREKLGGRWHSERWDSLHFQFPNWALSLPGHRYGGDDPEGFSHYSKVIEFLADYAGVVDPTIHTAEVLRISRGESGLAVETNDGDFEAGNVVLATGAFPHPNVPACAARISPAVMQMHSSAYRNPEQLPPGAVLVVGTGSSGGQIAEELHSAGRRVYLSVSRHRRFPRRMAGKDMLWWLYELGWINRTIDDLDRKQPPAILVSGINGGHDLDVRKFAADGMTMVGRIGAADDHLLSIDDHIDRVLAETDAECERFRAAVIARAEELGMSDDVPDASSWPDPESHGDRLDLSAAGIASIIWCTGYRPAFDWVDVPVFDACGVPIQQRGTTACPGLYFLGLHWMHSLKSGALFGVGEDAEFIAEHIDARH